MSIRSPQWICLLAVVAAAIAWGTLTLRADEIPDGKPVKYSDPAEKGDVPNALPSKTDNDLLNRLQPAQKNNNNKGSLDGLPAPSVVPPMRSVTQDRKTQEMLDRRKDWIFSSPEQLILGPEKSSSLDSDNSSTSDGGKQKLTPMEEYYLKQFNQTPTKATAADRDVKSGRDAKSNRDSNRDQKDDSRVGSMLRDKEDQLKRLMAADGPGDASSLAGVRAGSGDFLGLQPSASTELSVAQKLRMDEYRQIYNIPAPQASMRELLLQAPKIADTMTPGSGLKSGLELPAAFKPTEPSTIFSSQVGMIPTVPQLPDVNARALNPDILKVGGQSSDFKPVAQPSLTPPRPTFQAPRRSL
jgi:hypothetical protein